MILHLVFTEKGQLTQIKTNLLLKQAATMSGTMLQRLIWFQMKYQLTIFSRSGIYSEIYKNSNQVSASDTGTNGPIADGDPYVLRVGDSNSYLKADIAEIIVFNKALTMTEYAMVNAHLAKKWNLTAVVDSDGDGTMDDWILILMAFQ